MRRWSDKLAVVCTFISVLCMAVTVVVVAPTVLDTSSRTDDVERLAVENAKRTREVAALTQKIQDERARNVLTNCGDVNDRHDNAIRELDRIYERRIGSATRGERVRLRQGRDSTVLLIQALTPHRNCRALADRQVDGSSP